MASPYRIVILQLLTAVVAAALLALWDLARGAEGPSQAVAALAAGMACVVPGALYAWRAAVERSAARFLLQGVLKFLATLVLMAAFIVLIKPAALGFFGTFVLMQAMYVIGPLHEAVEDARR